MFRIDSFVLHILAIIFMTCDHIWATVVSGSTYLTCIGRLAYPIFAYIIVEGFFHTKDLKKYMKRILIFAIISEIPFNLIYSASIIYPFHQNVLWTFLIGLFSISKIDNLRKNSKSNFKYLGIIGMMIIGYLIATIAMTDYFGNGVLTMFIFYFFHGKEIKYKIGQVIGLYIINFELIKGLVFPIELGNITLNIPQQGFAIFSLIPIWLYNEKQGLYNKYIKYFYYIYYPLHMLILYLINYIIID